MADIDRNERIRQRAYEIWEQEGQPEGREAEHWQAAERELFGQESGGASAGRTRSGSNGAAARRSSAKSGSAGTAAKGKEGAGSVAGYGSTPGDARTKGGGGRRTGKNEAARH